MVAKITFNLSAKAIIVILLSMENLGKENAKCICDDKFSVRLISVPPFPNLTEKGTRIKQNDLMLNLTPENKLQHSRTE